MTANASETILALVEETAWGTTPATPAFRRVRFTGEGLVYEPQRVASTEITGTPDASDETTVGGATSGPVNFELSFDAGFDLLFAHALRGSWVDGTGGDDLQELEAGAEKKSLTVEKEFDLSGSADYSRFPGMTANTLNLTMEAGGIVSGSVDFIGASEVLASAAISGATYAGPGSAPLMAAPHVAGLTVAGVVGSFYVQSASFTVNNNAAVRAALGTVAPIGVRYGKRTIEGNFSAFFDAASRPLYERFVAGTASDLTIPVTDADGNAYTFHFPRVFFTTGRRVAGADGEDVIAEIGWRATFDETAGYAMRITRTEIGA